MPVGFLIWGRTLSDQHKGARPIIRNFGLVPCSLNSCEVCTGLRGAGGLLGAKQSPATSRLPASAGRRETADVTGAFHPASQENTNFLLTEICQQIFSHSEVTGSRRHWLDMMT